MGILDFDAPLYLPGMPATPAKNSYEVSLNGLVYRAVRAVTFPEHKVEKKVIVGPGGQRVLTITAGVLNADSEGTFKLLPLSGDLFMRTLQASRPIAALHSIPFTLEAFAVDPLTKTTTRFQLSNFAELTNVKHDDIGDGSEEVGIVFSYKSRQELHNGLSLSGVA